jgi:hypothetical protein
MLTRKTIGTKMDSCGVCFGIFLHRTLIDRLRKAVTLRVSWNKIPKKRSINCEERPTGSETCDISMVIAVRVKPARNSNPLYQFDINSI